MFLDQPARKILGPSAREAKVGDPQRPAPVHICDGEAARPYAPVYVALLRQDAEAPHEIGEQPCAGGQRHLLEGATQDRILQGHVHVGPDDEQTAVLLPSAEQPDERARGQVLQHFHLALCPLLRVGAARDLDEHLVKLAVLHKTARGPCPAPWACPDLRLHPQLPRRLIAPQESPIEAPVLEGTLLRFQRRVPAQGVGEVRRAAPPSDILGARRQQQAPQCLMRE
mmetsp:Transcript_47340/g.137935  ORF Transcript_47340/g.137935 Transcript_47340/m.137935 type:complete len:226 (-) Transcript_47340:131-808(-)